MKFKDYIHVDINFLFTQVYEGWVYKAINILRFINSSFINLGKKKINIHVNIILKFHWLISIFINRYITSAKNNHMVTIKTGSLN